MKFQDDKSLYGTIGRNIKSYRLQSGLTQSQLADKIGISISYLTKIEAEKCNKSISLSILNNIANSLNVEITEFFKETD